MARVCEITGKKPAVANNVSHAKNRTKRWQLPNLQSKSFQSDVLGRMVALRLSTNAMRTMDKNGGLDNFMMTVKNRRVVDFSINAKRIRKAVLKKVAANEAVAS